jgi:DNA mismatch repair protein MutS
MIASEAREILATIPDIERALSRLATGRGGPRDLAGLAQGLYKARTLSLLLNRSGEAESQKEILALAQTAQKPAPLAEKITPALADELPLLARDGHFIRQGYDRQLDELRQMRDESRRLMANLQAGYAEATGITALKIKHNNVLGYHIEVRAAHAEKLMQDDRFIHRQTTAQAVRFTTTELAEKEQALSSASDRALALEILLFEQLVEEVIASIELVLASAEAIAALDVACSTARLAELYDFCCPHLTDDTAFSIEAGRHPVVEQAISQETSFIANDCILSEEANLWLLTGPNMAGKSTYLRQNAHMAILAQSGFYVPAKRAEIGIVDKIFSRVGASDDLARGQSTFMVEMVETAAILNQSTAKSLVILDEIGRGTATWDGLAIAWACLEYLHDQIACRALFATHYHELTALQAQLPRLRPYAMQVKEWKGAIIFLHQVASGAADKSYGVHVARLAGLPKVVTRRAGQLVSQLEAGSLHTKAPALPLFDLPENGQNASYNAGGYDAASEADDTMENLRQMIAKLEPDSLTPKQALSVLYDLKSALPEDEG